MALVLSTAYAPPLKYMALLYAHRGGIAMLEAHEHIVKQSWRNRCDIMTAGGVQSLTIPIERPLGGKTPIKDILISSHGDWRHLHEYALRSGYGSSPFFEFYWDDIEPFYTKPYKYLWDFNWELMHLLLRLLYIDVQIEETSEFQLEYDAPTLDYRYELHPRTLRRDALQDYPPYYQTFATKQGFVPELSIYDLLMNMGPESQLYLRAYGERLVSSQATL